MPASGEEFGGVFKGPAGVVAFIRADFGGHQILDLALALVVCHWRVGEDYRDGDGRWRGGWGPAEMQAEMGVQFGADMGCFLE